MIMFHKMVIFSKPDEFKIFVFFVLGVKPDPIVFLKIYGNRRDK